MKKKIENVLLPPIDKCNLSFKNFAAFTLAEILLSLTVIGIVAAIALPSLLGNANERAWETQKKALYTRFSQALPLLPSLNGYGELVGNLSNCTDTNSCHSDSELKDTAAETFVRDGLSKVMKITNICDSEHLTDCGLPDKIIPIDGSTAINITSIKSLKSFHSGMIKSNNPEGAIHEQLDTKASAFETVNGESVLVYYNPDCASDLIENDYLFVQTKICANFVYDLNGKKGPNTVGKDIGFITALYSTDPSVVAPEAYPNDLPEDVSYTDAISKCREMDSSAKLPNKDEIASLYCNKRLVGFYSDAYWTSTSVSSTDAIMQGSGGGRKKSPKSIAKSARCIKR